MFHVTPTWEALLSWHKPSNQPVNNNRHRRKQYLFMDESLSYKCLQMHNRKYYIISLIYNFFKIQRVEINKNTQVSK